MRDEDREDLGTILKNLFDAYCAYVAGILHLAKLEAKLAVRSLIQLTILLFVLIILGLTCWLALQVVLFCALLTLHFSALHAAILVCLCNVLFILITIYSMNRLKKNLSFPATRRQLISPLLDEGSEHEQIETSD